MQSHRFVPTVTPLTLALLGLATFHASAARPHGQYVPDTAHSISTSWGVVQQPTLPTQVCATLKAALMPVGGSLDTLDQNPAHSKRDTARLQAAIDHCPAGSAVHLVPGDAGESGLLTGPLTIKSGVTLWIDGGVTLFGSRNPLDYDNGLAPAHCDQRQDEVMQAAHPRRRYRKKRDRWCGQDRWTRRQHADCRAKRRHRQLVGSGLSQRH